MTERKGFMGLLNQKNGAENMHRIMGKYAPDV